MEDFEYFNSTKIIFGKSSIKRKMQKGNGTLYRRLLRKKRNYR